MSEKRIMKTGSENYLCGCGVRFVIFDNLVQGGCAAKCPGCGVRVIL